MPVKSKSKKSPSTSSNPLSTSILSSLNLDADEAKRAENKVNDLKTIILMIHKIDSISASSETDKLIELAELTDKINRHAKDNQTIRNTYGKEVPWQDIYHIKAIADNKREAMENISADLFLDLSLLKNKLLFILKNQSDFINLKFDPDEVSEIKDLIDSAPNEIGPKLDKIETNISREYSLLIIERIKLETSLNESEFLLGTREDKYFFARKLTIIGELLDQLSKDNKWSNCINPNFSNVIS